MTEAADLFLCRTCGRLRATEAAGECASCQIRREPEAPALLYRTFPTHSLQSLYVAFVLDRAESPTPRKTAFCDARIAALRAELERRGDDVPVVYLPTVH